MLHYKLKSQKKKKKKKKKMPKTRFFFLGFIDLQSFYLNSGGGEVAR